MAKGGARKEPRLNGAAAKLLVGGIRCARCHLPNFS